MATRTLTDTATISWDEATADQQKGNVVDGSITAAKLDASDAAAIAELVGVGVTDSPTFLSVTTPLIQGGTGSGDDLRLTSTSNATKGTITIGNATTGIFYDESNERLSTGANDQNITVNGASTGIDFSIHNDEAGEICQTVFRYSSSATRSACWWGARARGNIGAETIVQANDRLVTIQALGFDGVDYEVAAQILAEVAGTPGSNDMPGRWVFLTTPDGSVTPVEAMRIDSAQVATFANTPLVGANAVLTAATGQPLDSDLTAIAALVTAAYGRSLLTLASAAALAAEVSPFIQTNAFNFQNYR